MEKHEIYVDVSTHKKIKKVFLILSSAKETIGVSTYDRLSRGILSRVLYPQIHFDSETQTWFGYNVDQCAEKLEKITIKQLRKLLSPVEIENVNPAPKVGDVYEMPDGGTVEVKEVTSTSKTYFTPLINTTAQWLEKRIEQEKQKRISSKSLTDEVQFGGKIRAFKEVLNYLKTH